MNSRTRFATQCSLALVLLWGCTSVDRSELDGLGGSAGATNEAGARNEAGAGAAAGAGPVSLGGAGSSAAGQAAVAGQASQAGSSGATPGGNAGSSMGGLGSAGAPTDSNAGSSDGGAAGAQPGSGEAGAGGEAPVVLLKNPSFELGALTPWEAVVTPKNVGNSIYPQWGSGGVSIDGKYEVSFWNGTASFKGDLHQTVTGLTPGKYQLKAYIAFGSGLNAAYLYAIGCGPSDVQVDLPIADPVPEFAPFSIPSIDVTEDHCTVGLFVDSNTGDWLNADAFAFDVLQVP